MQEPKVFNKLQLFHVTIYKTFMNGKITYSLVTLTGNEENIFLTFLL